MSGTHSTVNPVFCTKYHVPDTVIQTARNPLPNQIAGFLSLYKVLITVNVCDVPESLPFDLITRSTSAEGKHSTWCSTYSLTCDGTCVD